MTTATGVYAIVNTMNGKVYVGSSHNILQRWHQHRCDLRHNNHSNSKLQYAFNKYGFPSFAWVILECTTIDDLIACEQWWMDELNAYGGGYNLTRYADNPMRGIPMSEEQKRKIGSANKGRAPNKGIPMSEEQKRKISIANKGKVRSEETKYKMSIVNIGKPKSEVTKRKLSQAFKGRPISEEQKRKISAALKGKTHKGVPCSDESRRKISEANKAYYARKRLEDGHPASL